MCYGTCVEVDCRIQFSSSTMWVLGIELTSDFGAVALTHSAILPLLLVFTHNYVINDESFT